MILTHEQDVTKNISFSLKVQLMQRDSATYVQRGH